MATHVVSEVSKPARRWRSTAATRDQILSAARDVFLEFGYSEASIGVIVERSSVSVGSIYHHFGGKAEIFDALWREYISATSRAAQGGIAAARATGATEPTDLFIAGAVAYLSSLADPAMTQLSLLFQPGDCPPGFDARVRRSDDAWARSNADILGFESTVEARLLASVATAIVAEGEYSFTRNPREVPLDVVVDEVARLLRLVLPLRS